MSEVVEVDPQFSAIWKAEGGFDGLYAIEGELYRQAPGRRTLRFLRGDKAYFIKIHGGVGWREIFKNLIALRWPVLGASNEYQAIRHLHSVGLAAPRIAAYAKTGCNPATLKSLIVTEEIGASLSLEDSCEEWASRRPAFADKRALIAEVAEIARRMHASGVNHRDFYLCHFLRSGADGNLYLMDLHRAQVRPRVPRRWRVKDIGGLYYSAMDIGLTRTDRLRFIRAYSGLPLREALRDNFWTAVNERARTLYRQPRDN